MALDAQPAVTADPDFEAAFASFSKDEKSTEAVQAEGGEPNAADTGASDAGAAAVDGVAPAGDGAAPADPGAVVDGSAGKAEATPADPTPAPVVGDAAPAAAEPEPAAADPAPTSGEDANAVLERLAALVKDKPAETPAAAPVAEELPALYTKDEEEFLTQYEKDWGEVHRAQSLLQRQFGRDLVQYVFDQVGPQVRELRQLTDALANRAHFKDLSEKIGPIDDNLKTHMDAWVDKQPGYLQTAYKQVLTTGTVEEVADLVDRFKTATGVAAKPSPAPSKGGSELSEPAKQAAESLAPVSSKRSVIEQQDDPNDFGAAFAKFSEMFKE